MKTRPLNPTEVDKPTPLWKEFMNDPSAIDQPIPTHEENTNRMVLFISQLLREGSSKWEFSDKLLYSQNDGNSNKES